VSKWEMMRLGDVGCFQSGGTPTRQEPKYFNGNIPWITTVSLRKTYIDENDAVEFITEEAIKNSATKRIPPNSLIIGIRVGVGKVSVNRVEMCTSQDILSIINIDKTLFANDFLVYCIKSYLRFFNDQKRGATIQGITSGILKDILIPVPPLETQQKIARALDAASELIALRKQQLSELDNLIKSTFYEIFGDPVLNQRRWEVNKLGKVGVLARGISKHRPRNAPELLGGQYPLIQTGDVANAGLYITDYKQTYSKLGLKQSKMWKKGTLCITIAANIAKTAILDFDACFPDSVVGFEPNELTNALFVNIWFSFFQKIIEEQAPESAQKNINLKILNDLDIIIPPLPLQKQFAETVVKIEEQKVLVQKAIDESRYLFDSLMNEYFE